MSTLEFTTPWSLEIGIMAGCTMSLYDDDDGFDGGNH